MIGCFLRSTGQCEDHVTALLSSLSSLGGSSTPWMMLKLSSHLKWMYCCFSDYLMCHVLACHVHSWVCISNISLFTFCSTWLVSLTNWTIKLKQYRRLPPWVASPWQPQWGLFPPISCLSILSHRLSHVANFPITTVTGWVQILIFMKHRTWWWTDCSANLWYSYEICLDVEWCGICISAMEMI